MAENENDKPNPGGGAVDPSEGDGPEARASAQAQEGSPADEKDKGGREGEQRTASKGINPVQHSE